MMARRGLDRKSTRLNSSHLVISYALFCLKKKKKEYLKERNSSRAASRRAQTCRRVHVSGLHSVGMMLPVTPFGLYSSFFVFFFFNDTATTEIYTLSLHDALPIYVVLRFRQLFQPAMDETEGLH